MLKEMRDRRFLWVAVLLLLASAKFLYPVFAFDLPLGYDPGIYRYLFLKYAQVFPSFSIPDLKPWAQEYPYGLFLFAAPLLKLGVPVSWFLGWIWSAMAVALLALLAWVFARREGMITGILILLTGTLSIAFYDGFAAMYWKTFFSLFFLVLTFHFFERKSLWMMVPCGALTFLSHNQTGLILGLALAAWWVLNVRSNWRDPLFRKWTIAFTVIAVLGLIWYAPIWYRAFWAPLKSVFLLRGEDAPSGEFREAIFYIRYAGILLAFGIAGFIANFRRERFTVWQLAVLVCAVFIVFKLVFYKRFFLQLDFFLLPFAAMGLKAAWERFSSPTGRAILVGLLVMQGWLSIQQMLYWEPRYDARILASIEGIPQIVEKDATVIALENETAVWLLGWLPDLQTGGPGLFDEPAWTYQQWEELLYGTHVQRLALLDGMTRPLYFVASPLFFSYYGDAVKGFLADSCLKKVEGTMLLKVVCEPRKSSKP